MNANTHDRICCKTRRRSRRRGATLLEAALTLAISLALVFGALDLGLAVFKFHLISYIARDIAREAIVHGSLADRLGPWGPDALSGTASGPADPDPSDPLTQVRAIAAPFLIGLNPEDVNLQVEWIDGGNDPQQEHNVRVTVEAEFSPILTFVLGNPTFHLTATSTMPIAH